MTTYVPEKDAEASQNMPCLKVVLEALGITQTVVSIVPDTGTFKGNEHSNPVIGAKHEFTKQFQKQKSRLALQNI